ncbi:MAG: DUF1465 family protein [Alphaproteobacteria bacterium]|nr:DUF1465 family protein [Alphaproteobacteria bacterium]
MPNIFGDTVRLLLTSHEYFQNYGRQDQDTLTPAERLLYSGEMSRITLRLTCIMSWLTFQRAVFNGRMSAKDAQGSDFDLGFQEACMVQNEEAERVLPKEMKSILDETFALYSRVLRLHQQILFPDQE